VEELSPAGYHRIRPLIPGHDVAGHMAFVHAVVELAMPGLIWVDKQDAPSCAIACNLSGFWFAVGAAPATLDEDEIRRVVARRPTDEPTALWAVAEGWESALSPLFATSATRDEFLFEPSLRRAGFALPGGFEIRPIDPGIARQFEGRVDPWVVKTWGGPEEFARRTFGFAILHEGELASFCTACAVGPAADPEAEIEIGTAPEFRQRGLAVITGNAFIDECLRIGIRPAWTCASENVASAKTAQRLGFRPLRRITGFHVP
jgi:GNAT superfamily N-acetyltransferase